MATDYLCTPHLEKLRGKDMDIFRRHGVNLIYAVADLPLPPQYLKARRPYIAPARMRDKVTSLFVENVRTIHRHGLKAAVAMLNEPSVRHGHSRYMAGVGFRRIKPDDLYTSEQLACEKSCWRSALKQVRIEYAVPVLEASRRRSVAFQRELAYWIRRTYPETKVLISCVGGGKWRGDPASGIYYMPSLNSLGAWMKSSADVRCNDGMGGLNARTAPSWIPQMVKHPGPRGWILWYGDYRGGSHGPGRLQRWHYVYLDR